MDPLNSIAGFTAHRLLAFFYLQESAKTNLAACLYVDRECCPAIACAGFGFSLAGNISSSISESVLSRNALVGWLSARSKNLFWQFFPAVHVASDHRCDIFQRHSLMLDDFLCRYVVEQGTGESARRFGHQSSCTPAFDYRHRRPQSLSSAVSHQSIGSANSDSSGTGVRDAGHSRWFYGRVFDQSS